MYQIYIVLLKITEFCSKRIQLFKCSADFVNLLLFLQVGNGGEHGQLARDPMRLPPASPFDNFLKAAGCQIRCSMLTSSVMYSSNVKCSCSHQFLGSVSVLVKDQQVNPSTLTSVINIIVERQFLYLLYSSKLRPL